MRVLQTPQGWLKGFTDFPYFLGFGWGFFCDYVRQYKPPRKAVCIQRYIGFD